jgi:diguanylate cyclase (GGDEF)-like protein
VRTEDVTARFGGEEFAVVCRDTSEAEAIILADRFRATLAHGIAVSHGPALRLTASVGGAVVPKAGIASDHDLLEAADEALYVAKRHGRDRTVVFGDHWFMLKAKES